MRNRQVTLIDLGLDNDFDASMTFVQSTLQNINAGYYEPVADISFVRSRDPSTIYGTMLSKCDVLHVMAHGDKSDGPAFTSSDGRTDFNFADLAEYAHETGYGIEAHTVLADACTTGTGEWQRIVRDSLEHDITYIGTRRQIGWHDSTVFGSAFYGALFQTKGRGRKPADQAREAAERAVTAYEHITGRVCPFKVATLTPSRLARKYVVDVPRRKRANASSTAS